MNAAERIYEAVARDAGSVALRGETLARLIEEDIAADGLGTGDSMGPLRELAARYGVGRSAICEAVRILERRGLARMRPGRWGGLILAKPALEVAVEELADFFRLTGVSLRQLLDAREAVDGAAARLAAGRPRSGLELSRLCDINARGDNPLVRNLALRAEVASLAGNSALHLFVQCLNSLTLDFAASAESERRRARPGAGAGARLIAALGRGDAPGAVEAACADLCELRGLLDAAVTPDRARPRAEAGCETQTNRSSEIARALACELKQRGGAAARLGSEWELCERFGVGRLILRQAIRTLEDRGLVACQRGRGHGLYARDPQPFGAIRQTVAWLMSEQLDPMCVGRLLCHLNLVAPLLAVTRARGPERQRLEAALAKVEASDPIDRGDRLELVRCVAELADVPVVDVFCRCLVAYEARFRKHLPANIRPAFQRPYLDHLRRLLEFDAWTPDTIRRAKAETAALMLACSPRAPPEPHTSPDDEEPNP